jgi:predicted metal-binding protein
MPVKQINLVVDKSVRNLCCKAYPMHPHGCPNFGKRSTCPPQVSYIEDVLDLSMPVYAIWNIFDFRSHVQKMSALHPEWSQRQLECCLYWQGTARKKLKEQIFDFEFNIDHIGYKIIACPEAMGVNVTETMKGIGELLEWPPTTKTYQVAIAGIGICLADR